MTSGEPTNVARCGYCGREFDVRRFLVRRLGNRKIYDSTECADLDEVVEPLSVKRRRGFAAEARLRGQ